MIKKVLYHPFLRFLFVGGINTAFGYLMYVLFVFLVTNQYVAVVFSTCVGVLFNFQTYGRIVFKSKDNSQIFRFFTVYLFIMAFQMLVLKLLNYLGSPNAYISGAIVTVPAAVLSYFLMREFVFIKSGK